MITYTLDNDSRGSGPKSFQLYNQHLSQCNYQTNRMSQKDFSISGASHSSQYINKLYNVVIYRLKC